MFAVVGAAGKVGHATCLALRRADKPVRAILRDASKAAPLSDIGCEVVFADLQDAAALAQAIGDAETVQIILPPSPQARDSAAEMRQATQSLAEALGKASPKRVLAISDYGAHVDHDIGIPSMFHSLEKRLSQLKCQKLFLRSAEHMQNWGRVLQPVMASGILPSFIDPADLQVPTVSAQDLGLIAAELLLGAPSEDELEIIHAEGPRRYSAHDVAATLSELLGRTVHVEVVPRSEWENSFGRTANPSLAELLIKTNDAQNKRGLIDVEPGCSDVRYGNTELREVLKGLLEQ